MKRSVLRFVSLITGISMLAAVTAGCGGTEKTSGDDSTASAVSSAAGASSAASSSSGLDISKHVTIELYMLGDAPKALPEIQEELNKLTEKDLNAAVNISPIPWADWQTKYRVLLTSGQTMDMVYAAGWTDLVRYAKDGAFAPLDEVVPKVAPELWNFIPKDLWEAIKIDGKIYDIPCTWMQYNSDGIIWREDLRQKYNLPEPTSIEGITAYMEGIKKNEPAMIPASIDATTTLPGTFRLLLMQHKLIPGTFQPSREGLMLQADKPAELINYFGSPMFAEDAKLWKSWADKGFWSKSALSDKSISNENFKNGKTAINLGSMNAVNYGEAIPAMQASHPDWKLGYKTFAEVSGSMPFGVGPTANNDGYAFTANSKVLDRAVALFSKLMLDKTYNYLTEYGIEGKHYKISADGYYEPVGDPATSGFAREAMNGWAWRNPEIQLFAKTFAPVTDIMKKLESIATDDPTVNFVFDDSSIKSEKAAYETVAMQYLNPILAGLVPDVDAAIKTFQEKAGAAGLDKIHAAYFEQYKKYCEGKGIK